MIDKSTDELKKIGNGFFETGKYNEAVKYYSLATIADPLDAESWDLKAVALFQLFKIDEAKESLFEAIKVDSGYYLSFYHLAEIEINQQNYSDARKNIEKALLLEPENLFCLTSLAFIELIEKKYDQCIRICQTILKEYPADKWALEYRSSSYMSLKKYAEAVIDLKKLLDIDNTTGSYYNDIGYAYTKLGELRKAKNNFLMAIELSPGYAYPYNNLGYVFFLDGDIHSGLKYINKSLELDASNSYAYKNRAILLNAIGKTAEARKDLQNAIDLGYIEEYGNDINEVVLSINKS